MRTSASFIDNSNWFLFNAVPSTNIGAALNTFMVNIKTIYGAASVLLPPGTFLTTVPINVPASIKLVGSAKRGTTIQATTGFSGAQLVLMGLTTDLYSFDCQVQRLELDCNYLAAVGVHYVGGQEGTGATELCILNYTDTGILVDTVNRNGAGGTCTNMKFDDLEIYASNNNSNYGFVIGGTGTTSFAETMRINRVTIVGGTSNAHTALACMSITNCQVTMTSIHCESCTDGVLIGTNCTGTIDAVESGGGVVNLIHITTQHKMSIRSASIYNTSAITNIKDDYRGTSVNDSFIACSDPMNAFGIVETSITVTASPFSYFNSSSHNDLVLISGGTVSSIKLARSGAQYNTGMTSGGIVVSCQDVLTVTYTVAPTMMRFPYF